MAALLPYQHLLSCRKAPLVPIAPSPLRGEGRDEGEGRTHGPGPPPNILRPIIVAPMLAIDSSTTRLLSFTSPPSIPCIVRHAFRGNTHSCSLIPPTPIGSCKLCLGPATNPSSDIDILKRSLDIPIYTSLFTLPYHPRFRPECNSVSRRGAWPCARPTFAKALCHSRVRPHRPDREREGQIQDLSAYRTL